MKYPNALWAPGPTDKQGYPGMAVNAVKGVICHSMVGKYVDAKSRLDGPDRASWHFSVNKDGLVYQHYDTLAVCWHAGTPRANGIYVGIEHEGGPPGNVSEPLTGQQQQASVALVRWLSAQHGFPMTRKAGLWEHNETGYPTACPSHRIPWAAYTPEQEEEMKSFLTWCPDYGGGSLWFVGPNGCRWITDPSVADDLRHQFGKESVVLKAKTLNAIGLAP